VIGGGAGAVPPMIGYAAASGTIDLTAALLFVLIFLWTPAHFWALALVKKAEYARARVPMLPVVVGEQETLRQMWIYAIITVAFSLIFVLASGMSIIYLAAASLAGGWFLMRVRALRANYDNKSAFKLYMASMSYLALLFLAMAVDRVVLA
jgi:protoheme IX farnesyltransferase